MSGVVCYVDNAACWCAQDLWGHGLPDLVFWNPAEGKALLVEVKVRWLLGGWGLGCRE